MANTLSGPYTKTTWTDGVTQGTHVNMGNLETQSQVALASINPDIVTSGFVLSGALATRHNSYSAAVLADAPLRYYRLDETSGTNVVDSGSGLINGTTANSPTQNVAGLLTGDADTCYTFAVASSQYIGTASTGLPTASAAPFTMEAWIKVSAYPAATADLFSLGDRDTVNHNAYLNMTSTGFIGFATIGGANVASNAALTTGAAHHVVGTYDGTTMRLYIDGALQAATAAATIALTYVGSYPFIIGGASSGTSHATVAGFWGGQIDEVAFYTTALSGTRVTAHYTAGTTATTQVDIASGKAYLLQSDGTLALCTIGAGQSETTVTINSTYHLYLQPDGSWYWSTSNSPAANSLAIATVTTDGSGNATKVTDARPLNVTLFSGAAGMVSVNSMPSNTQIATSSTNVVCNGTYQDVTGMTLTIATSGTYLIVGSIQAAVLSTGSQTVTMYLAINGTRQALVGFTSMNGAFTPALQNTVTQSWIVALTAGQVIKLQVYGTSNMGVGGLTGQDNGPGQSLTASLIHA